MKFGMMKEQARELATGIAADAGDGGWGCGIDVLPDGPAARGAVTS